MNPTSPLSYAKPLNPSILLYIWFLLRVFIDRGIGIGRAPITENDRDSPAQRFMSHTAIPIGIIGLLAYTGMSGFLKALGIPLNQVVNAIFQSASATTGGSILCHLVRMSSVMMLPVVISLSYQSFMELNSRLSQEHFMPRWLRDPNDPYKAGIIGLIGFCAIVIIGFHADEMKLLPLYLLSATIRWCGSQTHLFPLRRRGKRFSACIERSDMTGMQRNRATAGERLLNTTVSILLLGIFTPAVITEFRTGFWFIVAAIPMLLSVFCAIKRHYDHVRESFSLRKEKVEVMEQIADVVIVPLIDFHQATLRVLQYAKRLANHVHAVHVDNNVDFQRQIQAQWEQFPDTTAGVHLERIDEAGSDVVTPFVQYVVELGQTQFRDEIVTVMLPEYIPSQLLAQCLHADSLRLKLRGLLFTRP